MTFKIRHVLLSLYLDINKANNNSFCFEIRKNFFMLCCQSYDKYDSHLQTKNIRISQTSAKTPSQNHDTQKRTLKRTHANKNVNIQHVQSLDASQEYMA